MQDFFILGIPRVQDIGLRAVFGGKRQGALLLKFLPLNVYRGFFPVVDT